MRFVLDSLIASLEKGNAAVLGAIVESSGSAPRTSGARMLVLADGSLHGSIGGGMVEGACQRAARELLTDSRLYREMHFNLSAAQAADEGMVCGGTVRVLLQAIQPTEKERFVALREEYRQGRRPMLLTRLPAADKPPQMLSLGAGRDAEVPDTIREMVGQRLRRAPFVINHGGEQLFVEPLVQPGTVHLAGGGHVALATAELAVYVGFEVVVMDDREEFANRERYPQAREIRVVEGFKECFFALGADDFVVIVTRGHQYDRDVLAQALQTDAGYIGMIGSSKKRKAVYASLEQAGFSAGDLERVHSPIGLAIGSDTPREIGMSIVAELVKVRAGMKK